jgi:hypothetical protein
MPKIVESLDPYGLHVAFLDPHNLGTLSFDLFEQLAKLKRIDVIALVSLSDLQRNADRYTQEAHDQFDKFAPGWHDKVRRYEPECVPRRAHFNTGGTARGDKQWQRQGRLYGRLNLIRGQSMRF